MTSCLYACRVMHHRFAPKQHRFDYRIFLFALDLDELESLPRALPLFSLNRRNIYSFRENDYLPTGEPLHNAKGAIAEVDAIPHRGIAFGSGKLPLPPRAPAGASLKQRVAAFLRERGVELGRGRVLLVTLPRVFGYLFNPVSFYFCYDEAGGPVAAIAEVTNTFREMKAYFVGPPEAAAGQAGADGFRRRTPKFFYVSPFSDVDVAFDFNLRPPDAKLAVQIDDYTGSARTLTSVLTGERRPLTVARLAWWTAAYPLITLRIILRIHLHAALLWLKKVPSFAKAARPDDQRDLRRPHASIR